MSDTIAKTTNSACTGQKCDDAEVELKLKWKYSDGTSELTKRRFVYCWERISKEANKWRPVGLLLSDNEGTLRLVEQTIRENQKKKKSDELTHKVNVETDHTATQGNNAQNTQAEKEKINSFDLPSLVDEFTFSDSENAPFLFKRRRMYYAVFCPIELFLSSEFRNSSNETIKNWISGSALKSAPDQKWLDDPKYGKKFVVTSSIVNSGIEVPRILVEWLSLLFRLCEKMNILRSDFVNYSKHHLETIECINIIISILWVMRDNPEKVVKNGKVTGYKGRDPNKEIIDDPDALKVTNAMIILDRLSEKISSEYLGEEAEKIFFSENREKFKEVTEDICSILTDDEFRTTFRELEVDEDFKKQPFLDLLRDFSLADIITESYVAISQSPTDSVREEFYRNEILPFKIRTSYTLDDEQIQNLETIISPEILRHYLPHVSQDDIQEMVDTIHSELIRDFDTEECKNLIENLKVPINPNRICNEKSVLEILASSPLNNFWQNQWGTKSNLGLIISLFAKDSENTILKLSGSQTALKALLIDVRSGFSLAHPEIKYTEKPYVSGKSARRQRIKNKRLAKLNAGQTAPGASHKTPNNNAATKDTFSKSVVSGLFKTSDGKNKIDWRDGQSPYAVSMLFSSISLLITIQGTYNVLRRIESKGNATLEDMIELFKCFAAGGFSLSGILPEKALNTPLMNKITGKFIKYVTPANLLLSLWTYSSQCKKAIEYKDFNLVILTAFKASITAVAFTAATVRTVCYRLLMKKLIREATAKAVAKVAVGVLEAYSLVMLVIESIDIGMMLSKMYRVHKFRTLGAVTGLLEHLDQRFAEGFDVEANGKLYKTKAYCAHPNVNVKWGKETYSWKQIKDYFQEKTMLGLTVGTHIPYWNIDRVEGIIELNKKGVPEELVAHLMKEDPKTIIKENLNLISLKNRSLDKTVEEISKGEIDFSKSYKWLKDNCIGVEN
ncbi:MAG: hypothetical protein ACLFQE_06915 [Thermotogota bacterium]